LGIGIIEQGAQGVDRAAGIDPGTVEQRARDAARRDGADLGILIRERADQQGGSRGHPQSGE
jgi:hypothetical protein